MCGLIERMTVQCSLHIASFLYIGVVIIDMVLMSGCNLFFWINKNTVNSRYLDFGYLE